MRLLSSLPLLLLLHATLSAQVGDASDCLLKVRSAWGETCDKCEYYRDGYKRDYSGTFKVVLENTCPETVEVKVAMQERNGVWRTFPVKALTPGERQEAYACHGTGKYMYWARRLNDTEVILPSDNEILSEYRGR